MTYQAENDKLVASFLERTFFNTWRNQKNGLENFRKIEFFLNTKCDLGCAYCYLNRYGEELYSPKLQGDEMVLNNLKLACDWLTENRLAPDIELFSGEIFVQDVGFKALDMILDNFGKAENKPSHITIPTNYTFILDEGKTERVEQLLAKSRTIGIPIRLSASIDGKYSEANRPFRSGKSDPRDDGYYDKVFVFNKKWHFSFHPMIYSENIEQWPANFSWFQKMFVEHGIPWDSIYLLEVRNVEWSKEKTIKFEEFIRFLIKWAFAAPCHSKVGEYLNFVFGDSRGFNILGSPLTTCGRGLGCSIQATLHLRLGDLTIIPCHRTSYAGMQYAHFEVENNKIVGITADNPELMIAIISLEGKNLPVCEVCLLKHLCSLGCLGSQQEVTGDLFSPIPTVCRLEHAKIRAMVRTYRELGMFDAVCSRVDPEKKYALEVIDGI